ncbi:MAG TPA: IS110 family transposase [Longimicrobium sp.]|jgi:transposase
MMLHAIDLHKRSLEVATMRADGEGEPRVVRMPACERALGSYLRQWPLNRHRVVVETTGSWYWIADLLREHRAELKLAHAAKVQAITAAKVKTDSVDALTLLTMLRLNLVPEAHVISPELRGLRDLLRQRLQLVEKRTSSLNSIARLLEKYNRATVSALPELAQVQAGFHQGQISLIEAQIKALEKRIHRELKPNPIVRRLRRIPGIGRLCAWTLYLEIDGIARFATERKFFSYSRVVPGADNSGGRTRSKRSRAGNRYLKLAFSHAAVRAVQRYAEIGAAYRKKLRKKNEGLARAWVRKELARIVYHVLKDDVDYDDTFRGVPLSRPKRA